MKGFYITISNGLLIGGHRKKMGSAVWEFMWLIDRMTSISEEGIGKVLGGRPIKLEEIAGSEVQKNTVSENLTKLEKGKYINITRTGRGLIITVNKAQKIYNQKNTTSKDVNSENHDSPKIRKTMIQGSENHSSIYRQDSIDKTIALPSATAEKPLKTPNITDNENQVPPPPPKPNGSVDNLGIFGKQIGSRGAITRKLTKTQQEIIDLMAKYPELKQIRTEFKSILELEDEDGYELTNLKAWVTIYTKKVKKDEKKLIAIIKAIKSSNFWYNKITSGNKLLLNFRAIEKNNNEFVDSEAEEGDGFTEEQILPIYFEQEAKRNGTTVEFEKKRYEEERKAIQDAIARGEEI